MGAPGRPDVRASRTWASIGAHPGDQQSEFRPCDRGAKAHVGGRMRPWSRCRASRSRTPFTIFRKPTLAICETREEVVEEVRVTVVHEVGHHFGIEDDRLHELGWA